MNKIVNFQYIIDKMSKKKRNGNIIFFVTTIIFVIILAAYYKSDNFLDILLILGIAFAISLVFFIIRNRGFSGKIEEIKKYQMEIEEYCEEVTSTVFITKQTLMVLQGGAGSNTFVNLYNIESFREYHDSEGMSTIRIRMKNGGEKVVPYSNKLKEVLSNLNPEPPKATKIESSLVQDFYLHDGYSQGTVFVPGLNEECEIYVFSSDENSIKYAEATAKKAKEYTSADYKEAITCSLWAYRDYLKQYGYDKFLYEKDKIPIDVTESNIMDYMTLTGIASDADESNSATGIALHFGVPWEIEHGFSWVFKGKELIYVGSGDDVFPDSSEDVLKGDWNYAKKYHEPVTLTAEDDQKIKESYEKVLEEEKGKK